MLISFVMKEWLKVKWVFIGLAIVHGIILLTIYYDLANIFKAYKATEVIMQLLTFEIVYYINVKYAALLSGVMIGIFQFFPEVNQSRLKLSFHLPVKEHVLIFQMAATGIALLVALNVFDTIVISMVTLKYLPYEFFESLIVTVMPWYLGGICAYCWVVIVFTEPNWMKRVVLLCIGAGIVSLFFVGDGYGKYALSLRNFATLMVLSGSIIFLSAYNFKRGIW